MKRILSLILSVTFILSLALSAFASTTSINADKTSIKKGETVNVKVNLEGSMSNVVNFQYRVYFDSDSFELSGSTKGNACSKAKITALKEDGNKKYYGIFFTDMDFLDEQTGGTTINEGTIYTLSFKAIKDVTETSKSSFELAKDYVKEYKGGKAQDVADAVIGTNKVTIDIIEGGSSSEESGTDIRATISAPAYVSKLAGTDFNAVVYSTKWDNKNYKLLDALVTIPSGLMVTSVTAGDRVSGGDINYHLDTDGSLRIVYSDVNNLDTIFVTGTDFPAPLFNIGLRVGENLLAEEGIISVAGMSLKLTSDSEDKNSMNVINIATEKDEQGNTGSAKVCFTDGVVIKAAELFIGDGVDLIPDDKKAVLVSVTGLVETYTNVKLTYIGNETDTDLFYSEEISKEMNTPCYVMIVDHEESSATDIEKYALIDNYTVDMDEESETVLFGDTNNDSVINAQDALNVINVWIRKNQIASETEKDYLVYNVNSDARINTFDALGILESFVNQTKYKIITKAAALLSEAVETTAEQ